MSAETQGGALAWCIQRVEALDRTAYESCNDARDELAAYERAVEAARKLDAIAWHKFAGQAHDNLHHELAELDRLRGGRL